MKFKKGDVVVCVNNKYHNRQLEIGKEYTIFSVNYHSIILRELNQYVGCAKSSFEKAFINPCLTNISFSSLKKLYA